MAKAPSSEALDELYNLTSPDAEPDEAALEAWIGKYGESAYENAMGHNRSAAEPNDEQLLQQVQQAAFPEPKAKPSAFPNDERDVRAALPGDYDDVSKRSAGQMRRDTGRATDKKLSPAMRGQYQALQGEVSREREEYEWEGNSRIGPTMRDIRYMKANPKTDVLGSFEEHFKRHAIRDYPDAEPGKKMKGKRTRKPKEAE